MKNCIYFVACLWMASCSCDPSQPVCRGHCGDSALDAADGNWSNSDSTVVLDGGCNEVPTQVVIEPASATLSARNGERTRQVLVVRVTSATGAAVGGAVAFSTSPQNIGVMTDATTYEANGLVGGTVTVRATYTGCGTTLHADASLVVNLVHEVVLGAEGDRVAAASDSASRFQTATSANASETTSNQSNVVYPLDHAVMPQNVFPADVQWTRGASGNLYRMRLEKPHFSAVIYAGHSVSRHWLPSAALWRAFAQTDGDMEGTVRVDRLVGTTLYEGSPVRLTFARAALTGSVYYWDVADGRIIRIDDGTANATSFMPTPPLGARQKDGDCDGQGSAGEAETFRCVGCHTVSPSGRYMAGRLGSGNDIGAVFDLTRDLSVAEPPTTYDMHRDDFAQQTSYLNFASWRPDEQMLIASMHEDRNWCAGPNVLGNRRMGFVDPLTGREVAGTGLPAEGTQPAWSPDGTRIAYISSFEPVSACRWQDWGCWGGTSSVGNVSLMNVAGTTASNARVVHTATQLQTAPETGAVDCYPTWSPDSQHLAFHHGTLCRTNSIARRTGGVDAENTRLQPHGALYWMLPDGQGVTRLDRANGAGNDSFNPSFTPFNGGGYYWLVFISRRAYGNAERGTAGAVDAAVDGNTPGRQQIWITAVRTDGQAGSDPSSVPYWLPGQRTVSKNIAAYYAPRACRAAGDSCTVASECCGGDCRPNAQGALVCSPSNMCRMQGQTCDRDEDCCDRSAGAQCIAHVCEMLLQ